jgi:hypothetical protein
MAQLNFNEIKVFDNAINNREIIRTLINTESPERAFYMADIGSVIEKHHEWLTKMPRVIPHFGISILSFTFCVLRIIESTLMNINRENVPRNFSD